MKINAKKCKEMRIFFLKDPIEFPHLKIDDQRLELVTSHKVLGLVIQSNLKWNKLIYCHQGLHYSEYSEYFVEGALRVMIELISIPP